MVRGDEALDELDVATFGVTAEGEGPDDGPDRVRLEEPLRHALQRLDAARAATISASTRSTTLAAGRGYALVAVRRRTTSSTCAPTPNMQLYGGCPGSGWHNIELCGTGCSSVHLGPVPGWCQKSDGCQHRHHAGWSCAHRNTGGHGDYQLRRHRRRPTTVHRHLPARRPRQADGSSPSAGTIAGINWATSTDASPPTTYRIYRDGNPTPRRD